MNTLRPESPETLAQCLCEAAAGKQTIRLGGRFSKDRLGGPPQAADVTISTACLNRLVQYDPRDLTISVQAGMRFAELERILGEHRQMLPLDPGWGAESTAGGVVAANISGPRRRLYGTARDMIIGMTFATLEGKLVNSGGMVVKNVAGLDMAKLMTGSFGTLAGIAVVNFKVFPVPAESRTFEMEFATAAEAFAERDRILRGALQPMALDLINWPSGSFRLLLRAGGSPKALDRYRREWPDATALPDESIWDEIREYTPRFLAQNPEGSVVSISSKLMEMPAIVSTLTAPFIARAASGVIYAHHATACPQIATGEDFAMMTKVKELFDPGTCLTGGASMAVSNPPDSRAPASDGPREADLSKCVHCGLCLNACPTYRELHVEMDSPRGRIYQMVQVSKGAPITESYQEHMDLCLACRGCETACPSGVEYGRLIEAARADIEQRVQRPLGTRFLRWLVFERLLPSAAMLRLVGAGMYVYQTSGLQKLVRSSGMLKLMGKFGEVEPLAPQVEAPFFYRHMGRVFPAQGERKYRVAFLSGCIANISFARLNEATVRVLQANGCEVTVHAGQTCCGALHVHAGLRTPARRLARQNIDALVDGGFDAVITNAGGCGSTLKEYDELLEHDPQYAERARRFVALTRDVNEFLASIELNPRMGEVRASVTYQDSCHLAHGQKIRSAPRQLLARVPGLTIKEMRLPDLCCGSAGIYNVVHTDMAMQLLEKKMQNVNATGAERIATANPGCMLQLRAGVVKHGHGQRVYHVVEILDEAYRGAI